jgi:hypothetical protein
VVNCSWLKKDLTLEAKVNTQEEQIKALKEESARLKESYNFQTGEQAEEIESVKELIKLFEAQQRESSIRNIYPFIPETVVFCGEKVPLDRFDVRKRLKWALMYESRRWAMALIFLRSGCWFPMIEKKIKELELPEDLEYAAVAESDLNIEAYSSAGAVALWQIIRSTGRDMMNLRVDSYVDERRDPEKSTEAALKHLKELYQELGTWMDALACYNMHKDRYVDQKAREQARDFYDVKGIPLQTRRYPFRAIAVKLIMENPEKYGFPPLEEINKIKYRPYPIESKTITVVYQTERIVDIAQRLGMTYYQFKTFNPHLAPTNRYGKAVKDYLLQGKYKVYVKTKKTQ